MNDSNLLEGRYRLGQRLGQGGMGEVRLALDVKLGRAVAVKILSPELSADPVARERFAHEASWVAGLTHPNIVSVYDSGEQRDASGAVMPYIVMELVRGSTLKSLLSAGVPMTPDRALTICRSLLAALTHSHAAEVVHSDIKPANVMITTAGEVKLMDFGIAQGGQPADAPTGQRWVLGTAKYLSPEQARGERVDARSDIYSVGCLLYELLTGQAPFLGSSSAIIAARHLHDSPVPPSELNARVDSGIDAIVLTALAKEPAERYQSAAAMSADVEAAQTRRAAAAAASRQPRPDDGLVLPVGPRRAAAVSERPRFRAFGTGRARRRLALVAGLAAVLLPTGGALAYQAWQGSTPAAEGVSLTPATATTTGPSSAKAAAPAADPSSAAPTVPLPQRSVAPTPTITQSEAARQSGDANRRQAAAQQARQSSSSAATRATRSATDPSAAVRPVVLDPQTTAASASPSTRPSSTGPSSTGPTSTGPSRTEPTSTGPQPSARPATSRPSSSPRSTASPSSPVGPVGPSSSSTSSSTTTQPRPVRPTSTPSSSRPTSSASPTKPCPTSTSKPSASKPTTRSDERERDRRWRDRDDDWHRSRWRDRDDDRSWHRSDRDDSRSHRHWRDRDDRWDD